MIAVFKAPTSDATPPACAENVTVSCDPIRLLLIEYSCCLAF